MNIDTTSVFELDGDPGPILEAASVESVRQRIVRESSYLWNFDSGNHFISLTRSDAGWALVLHSNEKEFKDQYNGLFPRPGNWFADRIRVADGPRPMRFVTGDDANTFAELAEMLVPYNRLRHRLIAQLLLGNAAGIAGEWHKEHYFMPTRSSAAIGAFLCEPQEQVLVFSAVGRPLMWFEPDIGGANVVNQLNERDLLVVPHGWGMTADPFDVVVQREALIVNGCHLEPIPGVSIFERTEVRQRLFGSNREFVEAIAWHTPGRIVKELTQVESYSKLGALRHADR